MAFFDFLCAPPHSLCAASADPATGFPRLAPADVPCNILYCEVNVLSITDITRTMKIKKDLNVVTGGWWRWTRYEIRDGYIRPAPGSRLESYDPRDIWLSTRPPAKSSNQRRSGEPPYQSLLRLLGELEYRRPGDAPLDFKPAQVDLLLAPLTDESEAKLLEWCAQYGLLGILLHRTVQITLAPRTGLYQVQHTKIGAGWSTTEIPITRHQPILIPFAIVQPLRGAGPIVENLSAHLGTLLPRCSTGAARIILLSNASHGRVLEVVCRAGGGLSLGYARVAGFAPNDQSLSV